MEAINIGINDDELVIFVNGTDFNKSSFVSIEVQDNKTDSNNTDIDIDNNQSDDNIQFDEINDNNGFYNDYSLNLNKTYSSLEKTGNPILLLLLVLLALPLLEDLKNRFMR